MKVQLSTINTALLHAIIKLLLHLRVKLKIAGISHSSFTTVHH